jgi:KipI family sensor histidine kinase inhibitor
MGYKIYDYGDSGILVEFSKVFTKEAWHSVNYLAEKVKRNPIRGQLGIIPTYSAFFISFDIMVTNHTDVKSTIREILNQSPSTVELKSMYNRYFKVPIAYSNQRGPDLDNVSKQLKITNEEVISLFCSKPYQIVCISSPPGLPMMDAPPFTEKVPRLETPRTRVNAGSIAVTGTQAAIYTLESPGGWQLIGQTPIQLVDLQSNPPIVYKPGDYFEFFPITDEEFESYKGRSLIEMEVKNNETTPNN